MEGGRAKADGTLSDRLLQGCNLLEQRRSLLPLVAAEPIGTYSRRVSAAFALPLARCWFKLMRNSSTLNPIHDFPITSIEIN